ncbi:MAG TPA: DHA2 family efflux MFS transporter permease subunit [Rhizomicrobium sp.]|jgi:DHA2 family multidrug resistance protein|nr:DHA2 family efflux MFS transporter permease subunit [Rhizomicrobium sp.]
MSAHAASPGAVHSADSYESKLDLWIVLAASMTGTLMQALDSTIANVALPYMQGELAASRDQITWVLTSYIVAAAIMTAPVGFIASRFGKRNFLLVSLAGFTITSMMCGAAQSLEQMVLFRLLQGCFGAALSPLSQAVMLDLYPPHKRGNIMAIWGMGVMLGPILGPTLGGYLTDAYSWRWVFYVNVPFGIAAVAGIWFCFKDTGRAVGLRFDWFGFVALAIGLAALQLMLDRGTGQGWFGSGEIIAEAVVAGVGIYVFLVHMILGKNPFIPMKMFEDRNFVSGLILMFVIGAVLLASSALLPPFLQNLAGLSVFQTGMLMAPRGFGTMFAMMFAGRMALKFDPRVLMSVGCSMLLWSMWDMSGWTPAISSSWLTIVTFIQGIGMGLVFVPMNLTAFATLPGQFRTDGTAMTNLMRNIGSAIGVSVTTAIMGGMVQISHALMTGYATPFNRALGQNAASMMMSPQIPFGLQNLNGMIEYRAQVFAFQDDFLFMFYASLPALLVIWLMKRPVFAPNAPKPEMEVME